MQWANEQSIAAVERNGGVITTAYYDIACVTALCNPEKWFKGKHNLLVVISYRTILLDGTSLICLIGY